MYCVKLIYSQVYSDCCRNSSDNHILPCNYNQRLRDFVTMYSTVDRLHPLCIRKNFIYTQPQEQPVISKQTILINSVGIYI